MAKDKGQYTQHPAVYITKEGQPSLLCLLHFFKDFNLPKWQKLAKAYFDKEKKRKEARAAAKNSTAPSDDSTESNMTEHEFLLGERETGFDRLEQFFVDSNGQVASPSNDSKRDGYYRAMGKAVAYTVTEDRKKSWFGRLLVYLFGDRQDPLKTFDEIKAAMEKESLPTSEQMDKNYKDLMTLISYLRKTGQVDQAREFAGLIDIITAEKGLMQAGFTKFVTAKDVIDFMLKSERGVMIDFLRSYRGILPVRVAEVKKKADDLCIFDNYVVLYYDDSIEKFKFIKKEAEEIRRRDPILFGMIDGSERLYYVTDWVTKDDDLTLENFEKLIGRRAYDIKDQKIAHVNAYHDDLARTMEELESNMANLGL